jgi:hypothetical protein
MADSKKPTLEELYNQQKALAEQKYAQEQALAKQTAEKQRASIADELAKQRQGYLSSRNQVREQGILAGRSLANQLQGRGLGSSGISQVAQLQNKFAEGQTLSDLASTQRDVTKAGMSAMTDTENTLANALRQAELSKQSGLLSAGESMYNREQDKRNLQMQLAQSLLEASMSGASPEQLSQFQNFVQSAGFSDNPEALSELLASGQLSKATDTSQGDTTFDNKIDWGQALIGSLPLGGLANAIENKRFIDLYGTIGNLIGQALRPTNNYTYNIPNAGKVTFNTPQEAETYFSNLYQNRENSNQIKAEMQSNGKILFIADGKKFNTFNKASNYLDSQKK